MTKNRCYISRPITGVDKYLETFNKYEKWITQKIGWSCINPARVNHELPEGTSYDEYMSMCLTMLSMCDHIFFMPGWEKSKGCRFERHYAEIYGLKILDADDSMMAD